MLLSNGKIEFLRNEIATRTFRLFFRMAHSENDWLEGALPQA
jgi:hypothetical protein